MSFPFSLKIALKDHNGKATGLARALQRAGHVFVADGPADVLLIDLDMPRYGYREQIDHFKAMGATVLLYPHGGNPILAHDGLYEPYEHVDGNLVVGSGHAEVLRRMEYPTPTHVVGWSQCEMVPFRPRADIRHVVFAPTHPILGGSFLADYHRETNRETYARLLEGPWHLTVRHLGTLENNGLWPVDGVTYVCGQSNGAHAEIDAADVVVACDGTFPSLAIARGVPTVICGQQHAVNVTYPGEPAVPLRHVDRYVDFMRYPFRAEDGPLDEIIHAAARGEAPIADWKRRFIGAPLDATAFVDLVERLALSQGAPAPAIDETRGFTVAAFLEEALERPELLATYARAFGPEDDATLVLWGAGVDDGTLLHLTQRAVAAAGLDESRLPDILLLPLAGSAAADEALAGRAQALLSEWPPAGRLGALPCFGAGSEAALAAAATLPLAA